MNRYHSLLKLASQVLTKREALVLNSELSGSQGYDAISRVLKKFNLSLGHKIEKNKYSLVKDGEPILNAVLEGSHEGMRIVPRKEEQEDTKSRKAPLDIYYSPAAIYERKENDFK